MDNIMLTILIVAQFVVVVALYYSYGNWQYNKGRLDGFNECSHVSLDALREMAKQDEIRMEEAHKEDALRYAAADKQILESLTNESKPDGNN